MATITDFSTPESGDNYQRIESAPAVIATADEVELEIPSAHKAHCFVGIQQFDANGDLIVGGAGTYAITVETLETKRPEAVAGSPIDAVAPATLNYAGTTFKVKAVPTGVTTTITYKLTLSMFAR